MRNPLKQFVPSSVCLKCEGCCRFNLSDSPWRPKAGQLERIEKTDNQGYLTTKANEGKHQCVYFESKDNSCQIYANRPFECALYPFILSKTTNAVEVYVHLACPYVQEKELVREFDDYVTYLKETLNNQEFLEFINKNSRMLHDYSSFIRELKYLFDLKLSL